MSLNWDDLGVEKLSSRVLMTDELLLDAQPKTLQDFFFEKTAMEMTQAVKKRIEFLSHYDPAQNMHQIDASLYVIKDIARFKTGLNDYIERQVAKQTMGRPQWVDTSQNRW